MNSPKRALSRGLGTSRKGSPIIGLQTLIDRVKRASFLDEMLKAAASEEDVLEAARELSRDPKSRTRRYIESGVIGAAVSPVAKTLGEATEHAVNASAGQRLRSAGRAVRGITRGKHVSGALQGALAGAGVQAMRESLQLRKAKRTYNDFIRQHQTPTPGVP